MTFHSELNICSAHCLLTHANNASVLAKVAIVIIPLNQLNCVIMVAETCSKKGMGERFQRKKKQLIKTIISDH